VGESASGALKATSRSKDQSKLTNEANVKRAEQLGRVSKKTGRKCVTAALVEPRKTRNPAKRLMESKRSNARREVRLAMSPPTARGGDDRETEKKNENRKKDVQRRVEAYLVHSRGAMN